MLKDLMKYHENKFTNIEKRINKWITTNSATKGLNLNISNVAQEIKVSPSALTRFCHKIQLSGWSELKVMISRELKEFKKYNTNNSINDLIFSLSKTDNSIKSNSIKLMAKKIIFCNNVRVFGESFTEILALSFSRKLNKIGIISSVYNVASDLSVILPQENSVNFFISSSGMNPNIKLAAEKINHSKLMNQTIFSIVTSEYSNIHKISNDIIFGEFFSSSNINQFELPFVSSIVIEYIFNAIFLEVYATNKESNDILIKKISKKKIR